VNAKVHAMRTEMLALPEAERAELVLDLLDSLDDRPFESDRADLERVWSDETARRVNQIDSGELVTDSWDEVMDKVAESRRIR
jgi:putative addiction module component (TIGR02574 family)